MIADQLTQLLRQYISERGYVNTGALRDSVNFTVKGYKLNFSANEYIKFLDDGMFIENFMNTQSFNNAIAEYLYEQAGKELSEELEDKQIKLKL